MKIISEKSEIEHCQEIFMDNLKTNLTKQRLRRKIKFNPQEVADSAIHNGCLWFAFKENSHEGNYWNSFGLIANYSLEEGYEIIAQINFPKKGIKRTGGILAEDSNGKRYILHRGNLQKKRQRISILQWWRENSYDISELDDGQDAILISPLEDNSLVDNITLFVERVQDFKENHIDKFLPN